MSDYRYHDNDASNLEFEVVFELDNSQFFLLALCSRSQSVRLGVISSNHMPHLHLILMTFEVRES